MQESDQHNVLGNFSDYVRKAKLSRCSVDETVGKITIGNVNKSSAIVQYGVTVFFVVFGVAMLTIGNTIGIVMGLVFILFAVFMFFLTGEKIVFDLGNKTITTSKNAGAFAKTYKPTRFCRFHQTITRKEGVEVSTTCGIEIIDGGKTKTLSVRAFPKREDEMAFQEALLPVIAYITGQSF